MSDALNSLRYKGYIGGLMYLPPSGGGTGGGGGHDGDSAQNRNPGDEQMRRPTYGAPRVVETYKDDYPRLQKFYEWEQFLDWVDWRGHEYRRRSHCTDYDWRERTMTDDFPAAMNLARFGWRDALQHIKELEKIDLPLCTTLQQSYDIHTEYNVAGGAVNIGRFLAGMPDCMRAMRINNTHTLPSFIQKILVVETTNSSTPIWDKMQDGYTVYQIIDAMERANIKTDITWVRHSCKYYIRDDNDYDFYATYVKIKNAGEPIFPERLLFQLAHSAMPRRLWCSEMERNSYSIRAKFNVGLDGHYGGYIPEWRPTAEMRKNTLVIYLNRVQEVIPAAAAIIKSQYDKIR